MKTVRMSRMLASMLGATSLFLVVPVSMSATPGMAWDIFYTGEGEPITVSSYQDAAAGQGFDLLNSGEGVRLEEFASAYRGTALGAQASGGGWDVFRVGDGDPLP